MSLINLIKAKFTKKTGTRYSLYIHSDRWREKAKLQYLLWNHRCALCHRQMKLHVHHSTYVRLEHEKRGDLVVLCEECHALFHKYYIYSGKTGTFLPKRKIK